MHGSSPNVNWAMWIMCPTSLFPVKALFMGCGGKNIHT
jgi:hypothetical protein